ncbi:MAG: transporter substrate-binding domain-containing protein [Deltaproteobacteria bacterium]|nr:transporter substrate-binding domain-containing protein [Deltaproteobacteria bacterium]
MRKKVNWAALVIALVLTAVGGQGFAADKNPSVSPVLDRIMAKKELVVGTAASMPPLNMKAKDGQFIGMEMDLARIFALGMEVKLTVKPMPFNELLPALKAGKVDMVLSAMTMTPTRNFKVAFVCPYFASGKSLLTKTENVESVNEIKKMNSPDKVLVALKGSTSQSFVEKMIPKAKLVLADDYDRAVAMVRNGQALAMVADYPICMVSVYRYPDAKLSTPDKPFSYEPIGVALPPNDPLLINWVQNFLGALEKDGDLKVLEDRWFKSTGWVSLLP